MLRVLFPQESLERKYRKFANPVIVLENASRVLQLVNDLEHVDDVGILARLLRGAGKQRAT